MGRRPGQAVGREHRHRPDRRALEGHPVPPRGLPGPGRDTADPSGVHSGRYTDEGPVHAVPEQAGQEDGIRRRSAQTPWLRVSGGIAMTTQTAPSIVPDFGDGKPTGRKLAIICSKGNLDMAYPGLVLANAALGEGV